ncbi:MAG: hypothetical protein PHW34_00855 [Hespellia sp.]|nr:hypothetical protein [Hespellia sp.]
MYTEYVILSMNKNTYRIAIGNRKGCNPILYLLIRAVDDPDHGFYSHYLHLNRITEAEGLEIQSLVESHKFTSAYSKLKLYLKRENSDIIIYGPCRSMQLSDAVPNEWFDGCKYIIDLLPTKIKGIIPIDIDAEVE